MISIWLSLVNLLLPASVASAIEDAQVMAGQMASWSMSECTTPADAGSLSIVLDVNGAPAQVG